LISASANLTQLGLVLQPEAAVSTQQYIVNDSTNAPLVKWLGVSFDIQYLHSTQWRECGVSQWDERFGGVL
jgi:hypothetical protein